jgi:2-dehydro-3-deoxygluconokinase
MNIIGVGECMIELSQAQDGLLRKSFAGDVFNTLYYAQQALRKRADNQHQCSFFSAVGDDPMSAEMRAFIKGHGVDVSTLLTIQGRRSGLYMIHLDGAERSFSYWRDASAARSMMVDRAAATQALQQADVIYFSGITLGILSDVDRGFFIQFLIEARGAGKTVVFDPNIRPALWPDRDVMRNAIKDASAAASLVLPSFDDEHSAFGDETPEVTARRYANYGASIVIVKNGADEILTLTEAGRLETHPTEPVDDVVDTTGAGDSFNGAFLAEYLHSSDIGASINAGQKCAALVISVHGALVPNY